MIDLVKKKRKKKKGKMEMKTWTIKDGDIELEVVEKPFNYDLHEFEVYYQDQLIGTITPDTIEDMENIKADLDRGESPIGWEDGMGNTIYIP